jgi:hypothetical protein
MEITFKKTESEIGDRDSPVKGSERVHRVSGQSKCTVKQALCVYGRLSSALRCGECAASDLRALSRIIAIQLRIDGDAETEFVENSHGRDEKRTWISTRTKSEEGGWGMLIAAHF